MERSKLVIKKKKKKGREEEKNEHLTSYIHHTARTWKAQGEKTIFDDVRVYQPMWLRSVVEILKKKDATSRSTTENKWQRRKKRKKKHKRKATGINLFCRFL